MSRSSERPHDLTLFGATGFVGRLLAAYLAAHAPDRARIALAGRSAERLEAVREGIGASAAGWPLLVADSGEPAAMARLAGDSRVVATTVGPYAKYGIALAGACAHAGTHYADLTGEVLFVRHSVERFEAPAQASGARIVHACGYDSVPSDLGVFLVHQKALGDGAAGLAETTLVARARGGVSGGTVDSLRTQMAAVRAEPALQRVLADPYALSPDRAGEPDLGGQPDMFVPRHDPLVGGWTAPFVMAPFNTRIVRRSNALQGWAYGRSFRYREVMGGRRGPLGALEAGGLGLGMGAVMAVMGFGPAWRGLDRVLPKPGQGPSQAVREKGYFRSDIHARTPGGDHYVGVIAGDGDPGYAATTVMLGESALALAFDADRLPARTGVLTPATAMGSVLLGRLRAAGFRCDVERSPGPTGAAW